MSQFALTKALKNHDPICGDSMTMAERELTTFFRAATELFGSEEAAVSAEDWLHEVTAINKLPTSNRQWRLLTVQVAARLANRVNASPIAIAS